MGRLRAALSRGRASPGPPVMWGHSVPHTPRGTLSVEKEFPESQAGEIPRHPLPTGVPPGTLNIVGMEMQRSPIVVRLRRTPMFGSRRTDVLEFLSGYSRQGSPTTKMQRRKQRSPRPPSRIKIPSRGTNIVYRCASSVGPAGEYAVPCGFPLFPGSFGENKKGLRFRNPGTCACTVLRRILMIPRG